MSMDEQTLGEEHAFPSVGDPYHAGLTKREYVATAIMAALIVGVDPYDSSELAKTAVNGAEALLEELAK